MCVRPVIRSRIGCSVLEKRRCVLYGLERGEGRVWYTRRGEERRESKKKEEDEQFELLIFFKKKTGETRKEGEETFFVNSIYLNKRSRF